MHLRNCAHVFVCGRAHMVHVGHVDVTRFNVHAILGKLVVPGPGGGQHG